MAEKKNALELNDGDVAIARAKDFWSRYNKPILIICGAIILIGGGWLIYKEFVKNPKENKANESIFRAEEYYRIDSLNLALKGDGQYPGFLSIISKYSGTEAANLAHYYAGVCYLKMDDSQNAVKYLKDFSTSDKVTQQLAYKLLGDAYGNLNQAKEAIQYYTKAGRYFDDNSRVAGEALYCAALMAETVLKDNKQAIDLYKELKDKFPSVRSADADFHLAALGVYN